MRSSGMPQTWADADGVLMLSLCRVAVMLKKLKGGCGELEAGANGGCSYTFGSGSYHAVWPPTSDDCPCTMLESEYHGSNVTVQSVIAELKLDSFVVERSQGTVRFSP